MRTRPALFTLLDQLAQRLIHQSLQLPPFVLRQVTHCGQNFRIYVGCEFLSGFGRYSAPPNSTIKIS